jgi:hypothetical protein
VSSQVWLPSSASRTSQIRGRARLTTPWAVVASSTSAAGAPLRSTTSRAAGLANVGSACPSGQYTRSGYGRGVVEDPLA